MKRILLVGKMNDSLKAINSFLSDKFSVQLGTFSEDALAGLIKITEPDIIVLSLVGMYDQYASVFVRIQKEAVGVPVLTLGMEAERERFKRFYRSGQFENLIRPFSNEDLLDAVNKRLGSDKEWNSSLRKKKVLVVDDNGPTLRAIKAMLEEVYDVNIVPSGMKAMTSIGKDRPDLILLDYEMPVCDGRQTLEMIRADEDMRDIPVIFLTSVNDREHIEKVLSLRPQGYLLKPPVKERLLEAIRKACSG